MKISVLAALLLGSLLLSATPLLADNPSLRCGTSLISIGDSMYKVRRKCGNPAFEQQVGERKSYRRHKGGHLKIEDITYVTEWVYEKNQGEYILTFEGSRLILKEFAK